MTHFNDELAAKLATNNGKLLCDWILELEGRMVNATDEDAVMLNRRIRIIRDHVANCDPDEMPAHNDDQHSGTHVTEEDEYLAGENDNSPNPYRAP